LQSVSKWQRDKTDWSVKNAYFTTLIGYHGNVHENQKRGPGWSSMNKYLSFGSKIANIGPVDPEIICLRAIIKKDKTRNAWQSLANSLLGAAVLPPSK